MMISNNRSCFKDNGYSLIEMLIVIFLISLVAAVSFPRLYKSKNEVGGAERVLEQSAVRILERRSEAIRLNSEDRRDVTEKYIPPLPMDFRNLSSTASLITEGDGNGDCLDDVTGEPVTCITTTLTSTWSIARRNDALVLPDGWQVASRASDLGGIPLIGGGTGGRGIPVSQIGFDGEGRAYAFQQRVTGDSWNGLPDGAAVNQTPQLSDAPFWTVYFVGSVGDQVVAAVGVAVHPSGLIERFRYDGSRWIGYENRTF